MKRLLIVAILVVLLPVIMLGCTRNNNPGTNTPGTTIPQVTTNPTATVAPEVDDLPGGVEESPLVTMSPDVSPDTNNTAVPEETATASPAAG